MTCGSISNQDCTNCTRNVRGQGSVLVEDGRVCHPVLVDHRHHQRDEFWPEIQVLYGWPLLLTWQVLLLCLQQERERRIKELMWTLFLVCLCPHHLSCRHSE